ncbi:MAG: hypothetical protein WEA10_05245, partial [Actinomycetota bacterium]
LRLRLRLGFWFRPRFGFGLGLGLRLRLRLRLGFWFRPRFGFGLSLGLGSFDMDRRSFRVRVGTEVDHCGILAIGTLVRGDRGSQWLLFRVVVVLVGQRFLPLGQRFQAAVPVGLIGVYTVA